MNLADQSSRIGALADPMRRALYEYVATQREPVGREEAARALDLATHKVKFHLDKLVAEGLLQTEFRRLSGCSGPGPARPNQLYRRAAPPHSVPLPAPPSAPFVPPLPHPHPKPPPYVTPVH